MAEVILRAQAKVDLLDIYATSLDHFGEEVARKYLAGIDLAFARLADHPEIAPKYPGLRPPVHFLTYRRHHILYDYDGATVWVARIVHQARDVRNLM
jgi:plasmid stabilization system protein ParE